MVMSQTKCRLHSSSSKRQRQGTTVCTKHCTSESTKTPRLPCPSSVPEDVFVRCDGQASQSLAQHTAHKTERPYNKVAYGFSEFRGTFWARVSAHNAMHLQNLVCTVTMTRFEVGLLWQAFEKSTQRLELMTKLIVRSRAGRPAPGPSGWRTRSPDCTGGSGAGCFYSGAARGANCSPAPDHKHHQPHGRTKLAYGVVLSGTEPNFGCESQDPVTPSTHFVHGDVAEALDRAAAGGYPVLARGAGAQERPRVQAGPLPERSKPAP